MAAAAVNGDASSVSGGRVFTFEGMMRAAAIHGSGQGW